ncbi:MAG TPA: SpoIIE family protein phosphatase [Solirubrobacteraceae bacterium]|nr:SpoIIE family protein phosphatase [Solirubrobacteraceae bacterium]
MTGSSPEEISGVRLGVGQIALAPADGILEPTDQVRSSYRFSDPALSELPLEKLLDELLNRVQEALEVDTVAILLYDPEANQLVARAAKGIEEEVERGVRLPLGQGFAGRIAGERVAIFIADVDHADILNPILREKGICSLLGVPLIVEGNLIGVMHVGSLTPRTFGQADLAVLQLAAARAAPAIERASLFAALEHEHRVSAALQRSLLPKRLVEVVGVDVAARYLPAREEVGGDWYDVIELPRGKVGVVIGDVVGHGIAAAALMGRLRTALHAYAIEGHGPGRTLELVDRFVQSLSEPAMATAAYAVFDTYTARVCYASAGHLPPIVISGEDARAVELTPAPPLGAFPYGRCPEHELDLASSEMLFLYTDGLVERRAIPLNQGIEVLASAVAGARTPEAACVLAMAELVPDAGLRDDAAIVALQNSLVPAELHLRLAAQPKTLAHVRRVLRRWLISRGADEGDVAEVTIAVSEACANAIEHAYSPAEAAFELDATGDNGEVTVAIRDKGRWRPPRGSNRGRGLSIMVAAMDDVQIDRTDTGTQVVMRRRLRHR